VDHLGVLLANSRGFVGQDLFQGIRQRPPVALLQLLRRRIERFDAARLDRRRDVCAAAAAAIRRIGPLVQVPGQAARTHYYWLFPVQVADPPRVARAMLERGFDATAATTSLVCIDSCVARRGEAYRRVFPPPDGDAAAARLVRDILYLPIDADTPGRVVAEMVDALRLATLTSAREARL
jgi:hypothetical protein